MITDQLLQDFPITLTGRTLNGFLYQSPHRRTGRRIVVKDKKGKVLFDTDYAYDLGNARNSLELWIAEQEAGPCASAPPT